MKTYCTLLTSVSNLVKKQLQIVIVCIFLIVMSFVPKCIRLATAAVKWASHDRGPLYSDAACVTWNNWTSYRQMWRSTRGNWARQVKLLMCHSSAVSLLLPIVPATCGQHFTLASCTSSVTLVSMYNVIWLCPEVHPCNIMSLTQNSFPCAMYVTPFNVIGIP